MMISNATELQVKCAAESIGAKAVVGTVMSKNRFRFVIRPDKLALNGDGREIFRSISRGWSQDGHKINAICWHGHRDFFRELFRINPDAVVKTQHATYESETFEDVFPATGRIVRGPPIAPSRLIDWCNCN